MNKIVLIDSISIVSFTSFLAFVVQTAYVLLHISETVARKRSVFEHTIISKIWSHGTHLPITKLPNTFFTLCTCTHTAHRDRDNAEIVVINGPSNNFRKKVLTVSSYLDNVWMRVGHCYRLFRSNCFPVCIRQTVLFNVMNRLWNVCTENADSG